MVRIEITRDINGFIEKSVAETHELGYGLTIHEVMELLNRTLAGLGFSESVIRDGHEAEE